MVFVVWTLASAAKAAKPTKPKQRIIPGKVVITRPKKETPGERRPFKMEFTVRVQWPESMFVNEKDIREAIQKKSQIGPGKGPPEIFIKKHPIGYRVRIEWPDSYESITAKEAKSLIESQDKRLYGRISDVKVTRR